MKRKLLAVLIAAVFAAPAAYAQGTPPSKDTGMTKDRPAASGSASTSAKGDAMKSDKGTAASAKGQAKADAKKGDGKSPDAVITGKIKTGFIKDKIVRSRNYNVDTKDGVVTVKGKARSKAELDRALEIAKKTEGVKDVRNEVQLMAAAEGKAGSAKSESKAGTSGSSSTASKSGTSTSASGTAKADAKKDTSATTTSKGSTTTK